MNKVPKTDIYVVEMQSHRIGKQTASLLPFAVHLRVFEAMLTCLLPGLVIPFDPLHTSKHFCLPVGTKKKRAAVNLVESLFRDRKNEEPFEAQCEQFLKEQQGMEGSEDLVESFIDNPPGSFAGSNNKPLLQVSPKFVDYFKADRVIVEVNQIISLFSGQRPEIGCNGIQNVTDQKIDGGVLLITH